ncbi:MAG: B12-binding domain-containing radical SAM protein, partial [Oscillospiraceae bacterium]|nr:B12-binding domain-containing radical SAM protein [Oscillospiraceae bacterium]
MTAVKKPARYTGGEFNSVIKDPRSVKLRVAFCFPDTYEIGMSHLGLQILYNVMNRMPDVWCERAFAPWEDMRALLLRKKTPLYALESGDGLADFDVLAFTLQYELCYTNVLSMLDLAGLP